jgi:hypothetical protein
MDLPTVSSAVPILLTPSGIKREWYECLNSIKITTNEMYVVHTDVILNYRVEQLWRCLLYLYTTTML